MYCPRRCPSVTPCHQGALGPVQARYHPNSSAPLPLAGLGGRPQRALAVLARASANFIIDIALSQEMNTWRALSLSTARARWILCRSSTFLNSRMGSEALGAGAASSHALSRAALHESHMLGSGSACCTGSGQPSFEDCQDSLWFDGELGAGAASPLCPVPHGKVQEQMQVGSPEGKSVLGAVLVKAGANLPMLGESSWHWTLLHALVPCGISLGRCTGSHQWGQQTQVQTLRHKMLTPGPLFCCKQCPPDTGHAGSSTAGSAAGRLLACGDSAASASTAAVPASM